MPDSLLRFRPELPILISHWLGAMPRGRVFDAIDGILDSGAWRRSIDRPVIAT